MALSEYNKVEVFNFFIERRWLFYLSGHDYSRSPTYRVFLVVRNLFIVLMIASTSIAGFCISEDRELTVHSLHLMLLLVYSLWVTMTRHITADTLLRTAGVLQEGIFRYAGQQSSEDLILGEGARLAKRRADTLAAIYYFMGFFNTFVVPFAQMMLGTQEFRRYPGVNPYFPNPFYLPLDTETYLGFLAGFVVNGLLSLCIYGVVVCSTDIFIACTVQLKAQLQVLNHSLRNIPERALAMYLKKNGLKLEHTVLVDLYPLKAFRDCLVACLKENVQHHHELLKFKKMFNDSYVGAALLNVVTVASMVYASHLYLIVEGAPLYLMINYILTLLGEISYPLFLCYYGEEVIKQSGNIFESLYYTPWMLSDRRFSRMLGIMMSYTLNPTRIYCLVFKVTASLRTFGDSISGMYKIVNVLRK